MQRNDSPISRTRRNTGNTLIVLSSLMLIGSAGVKLAQIPQVIAEIGALGFAGSTLTMIAILELVSALLFLLPLTRSFGLLMVSAYMGGAIATHVGHGQPFIRPAMVLAIFWLATWLRHPVILWRFVRRAGVTSESSQQGNPASIEARLNV